MCVYMYICMFVGMGQRIDTYFLRSLLTGARRLDEPPDSIPLGTVQRRHLASQTLSYCLYSSRPVLLWLRRSSRVEIDEGLTGSE